MEILSIHNNELTIKLESICSTLGASLAKILEIIKKDASTSYFDLIDDSNPCNQVLVKNIIIETCSDEIVVAEPHELIQLKCLSPTLEARPHLNRNKTSVPRI
jgi:hypothetical protein